MVNAPKTETKFIYWFAYYNLDAPSVRYRGKYPLEYLKKRYNINSYFIISSYKPNKILLFLRAYFSALLFRKSNSLIVIQRIHSHFIYATLLKFLIKVQPANTFYDIDDADYLDFPPKTIYHFIKNCSGVFVGSRELAKNLSKFNKNILLNTSPTPDHVIVKTKKNSVLTIGWIGDFAGEHKEALMNFFFPALKELPFEIKLVILGVGRKHESDFQFLKDYFKSATNINLEMPRNIDWNNETDIQKRITEFDFGVATILDNELHRSKSAFKLKQYLNNGVPVLSSDIPENNYFVNEGVNGFLCSTTEKFRQRIIEINEMSNADYMKLSIQARQSNTNFNLTTYCKTLITREGQSLQRKFTANLNGIASREKQLVLETAALCE
ncbi:MAG: glycosyltransferase [Bacteroidales bacterium]|nr:glycosyltransferase [Bacteroidales bacterium]